MKKHLVIGDPIKHSLSPKIHNYWFKKNNIDAIYEKYSPSKDQIEEVIKQIKDEKLFAMNVTVPYKQTVIPFLEELSPEAQKTNSVNTIFKKNGKIFGDNTDIIGFELAIKNENINLSEKTALILGAGGVVPSIILGLEKLGIKKIYISNRTESKIDHIKISFPKIEKLKWKKIVNFDICINATSLGLKENEVMEFNFDEVNSQKLFFDVIYNPLKTNFLKNAEKYGHKVLNGEKMFIYQAQRAFDIWHNILPDIDSNLIKMLRDD